MTGLVLQMYRASYPGHRVDLHSCQTVSCGDAYCHGCGHKAVYRCTCGAEWACEWFSEINEPDIAALALAHMEEVARAVPLHTCS